MTDIIIPIKHMQIATIIKIILMIIFFSQVLIFGKFISALKCFKDGKVMSTAMTFSGMLFLSIALLDIIPQAIANFDQYFNESSKHIAASSSLHSDSNLPLTMIIAMFTFLLIMYIDKIMIGHSHDHEYEVSFTQQPRRSIRDIHDVEMKQYPEGMQGKQYPDGMQDKLSPNGREGKNTRDRMPIQPENKPADDYCVDHEKQSPGSSEDLNSNNQLSLRPFILQTGMSIHSFFECLAVGIQPTTIGVLGLASAIIVHKWAEGLTLGLIYRKQKYNKTLTSFMIFIQGVVNVLGLIVGTIILGQGNFIMAFFMSISAGTFLYISLCEVLVQQIDEMSRIKACAMIAANVFLIFLVWLEKYSQKSIQEGGQS